jgi:hypothetical protein
MEPIYPDEAREKACPFCVAHCCLASGCHAWSENGDGQGVCIRLPRKRSIQFHNVVPLSVIVADIEGDKNDCEVY